MELGYSTDRWCGFQVIDPTVEWVLSRVVPTIRRCRRFVSCCTTTAVLVCIPRLLAVVVSLKNYAAHLVLNIIDVITAILLYCYLVYDNNESEYVVHMNIIKPNPIQNTPRIKKNMKNK